MIDLGDFIKIKLYYIRHYTDTFTPDRTRKKSGKKRKGIQGMSKSIEQSTVIVLLTGEILI